MIYSSILSIALLLLPGLAKANQDLLRQELVNIEGRLQSIQASQDRNVPGVQSLAADMLMEKAEAAYRDQEYLATVRFLNQVLNKSSGVESGRYLKANYLLGRSYEELRYPARAIKAYLRYMSSYATRSKDNPERLIEVTRRLLLLRESMLNEESENFQRLLANLMGLDFPDDIKAEITLLSGVSAYHGARHKLAESWLAKVCDISGAKRPCAEASLYQGLAALAQGQLDKSESHLLGLAEESDSSLHFIRQVAALNLARLFADRKLPQHAWSWYQKVQGPGNPQRIALYESAVLLMQVEDFPKATQLAQTYIKSFPDSKEAAYLRERMAYLQLSIGKFNDAENNLNARQKELGDLANRINFQGKRFLGADDVAFIRNQTAPLGISSSVLDRSAQLFERLAKAKNLLREHRQELRSLSYTLGRISDPSLRPDLQAADRQFNDFVQDLTRVGDALISSEGNLYELSDAEKLNLQRSKDRRAKILATAKVRSTSWKSWGKLAQLEQDAAQLSNRLFTERARLAALVHRGEHSKEPVAKDQAQHLRNMQKTLDGLNERLSVAMEDQRLAWLQAYRKHSAFQRTRKSFLLLSQEFLESSAVLDEYRDRYESPERKHYQEDFAEDWVVWPRIAGKLLTAIKERDRQETTWLNNKQAGLEKARTDEQKLMLRQEDLYRSLGRVSGMALPSVLNHINFNIREQSARGKKWLADIHWQKYLQETEERIRKERNQRLEEAKVQEDMRDIEIERALHD